MRSWSEIGGLLIPIVSGGLNYLAMFISQKTNDTVITDDAGNKDAASATAQTGKAMTFMMPLVSVVFGYIMPLGLSIYWIAQSILGIVQDYFLTKHYRKIYDAEDEIKRQKAAALAEENAEKGAHPRREARRESRRHHRKHQQRSSSCATGRSVTPPQRNTRPKSAPKGRTAARAAHQPRRRGKSSLRTRPRLCRRPL